MSEPDMQRATDAVTPQRPIVSNYGLVLTVYILYLVGFLTGITVKITTFWIGLFYFFVGLLTLHFGIGALILLWYVIWTVIRCVKGLLALNMGEPIRNPNSWWFGDT